MSGFQSNSDSAIPNANYFDFPDLRYRVNAVLDIETKGGWHPSNTQTLISFICLCCAVACNLTIWSLWIYDRSNTSSLVASLILGSLWYFWSRQKSVRKPLFSTNYDYQILLRTTLILCSLQLVIIYNFTSLHPKQYLYQLTFSNCKYFILLLIILLVFHSHVLADRQDYLKRLKYKLEQEINKSEKALFTRRDLSFIYVQSLATDMIISINQLHDLLKQFNLRTEEEIHIGPVHPSTAGMVLFSCLNTMYESCSRLTAIEKFVSSYFARFRCQNYATNSTNKFQLGSLLQKIGDMVGPIASRENVDIVIDDIDFAFRDLPVYGDVVDLLHVLSDAVKFSIVSSVPYSSIEIGVRLPTTNQREKDPDRPNSVCYPFVFHITYTTLATTDILDSMDWIMRPLAFLNNITKTKIAHHRTADKRTLYITSSLCIPEDSADNIHTPFHSLPELSSTIRMFQQYQVWVISNLSTPFSRYLETCCTVLERKVQRFNMSDPTYFIRALRNLGEQTSSPLRPSIMIDDSLSTFCQVINCLLNRYQLTNSTRRLPQCDVIYFLAASDYLEATQFLESAMQKSYSGTFPKVTLVLKPIGFRRFFKYFSALHSAHPLSPTRRLQRLIDPDTLPSTPNLPTKTNDYSPPITTTASGSQILSPRITHRPRVSPSSAPNTNIQRTFLRSPHSSPHKETPQHFPKSPINHSSHNAKSPLSNHPAENEEQPLPRPPKPLVRTLSKTGKTKTSALAKAKAYKSHSLQKAISPNESYFPHVQYLPINVLIVEDNPINQTILATFMRKRNIKYSVANDGREALQKWKEGNFHLVLMDIQLPVMSGIEATKEIRRIEKQRKIGCFPSESPTQQALSGALTDPLPSPGTPPTPLQSPVIIVALTASSLRADRTEALAAGCNDFLTKPVSLVWLEKKIMEWGCMQALIDIQGWRRSKAKTPTNSTNYPSAIAEFSRHTPTKPNFTINPDSIMSKVKKRLKQDAQPASN